MRLLPVVTVCIFAVAILSATALAPDDDDVHTSVVPEKELKEFVPKRLARVHKNIEKLLGITFPESKTPRIGFVGTGGGYRAMIAFLAGVSAFQDMGMDDIALYMTGLSGSTWAINSWALSDMDIKTFFHDKITPSIARSFLELKFTNLDDVIKMFQDRVDQGRSVTLSDAYGLLVANHVITSWKKTHNDTMVDILEHLAEGKVACPISTAVQVLDYVAIESANDLLSLQFAVNSSVYRWMEFSPYSVASNQYELELKGRNLDSNYKSGKLEKNIPPPPMSLMLGAFGSAFEFNFDWIYQHYIKGNPFLEWLLPFMKGSSFRFFKPANFVNFMKGVECQMSEMPPQNDLLYVVDGGLAEMNTAVLPMLEKEREIDIIIVLNGGADDEDEMLRIQKFCKEHGFQWPQTDKSDYSAPFNVFGEDDPNSPTVVHFPINHYMYTKDETIGTHFGTLKLQYDKEETEKYDRIVAEQVHKAELMLKKLLLKTIEEK